MNRVNMNSEGNSTVNGAERTQTKKKKKEPCKMHV